MMLGQSTLARNPAQKGTDSYVRLLIIPRGSSQTLYKKTAVRPRGRLNLDIQVALARRSCRLTTLLFPPAEEPATDVDQSPANFFLLYKLCLIHI